MAKPCYRGCDPPCSYGCALRQKGVTVAPSALPSQMNSVPPRKADPAWERGIVTEKRPGGHVMPILAPGKLRPLHVKELANDRSGIEAKIRQAKNPTLT